MVAFLRMHARSIGRDLHFQRILIVCASVGVLTTYIAAERLLRRSWTGIGQGSALYTLLTFVVFGSILSLQPHRVGEHSLELIPYARWQHHLAQAMVPFLNACMMMAICLPLYALAAYTGGVRIVTFAQAGCLLAVAFLFASCLQLNYRQDGGTPAAFSLAFIGVLSGAPFLLTHLEFCPEWLLTTTQTVSVPYVLLRLFSADPGGTWKLTSLIYACGSVSLWIYALRSGVAVEK